MESSVSSETLVTIYQTTLYHIPEYCILIFTVVETSNFTWLIFLFRFSLVSCTMKRFDKTRSWIHVILWCQSPSSRQTAANISGNLRVPEHRTGSKSTAPLPPPCPLHATSRVQQTSLTPPVVKKDVIWSVKICRTHRREWVAENYRRKRKNNKSKL